MEVANYASLFRFYYQVVIFQRHGDYAAIGAGVACAVGCLGFTGSRARSVANLHIFSSYR